MKNLLTTLLLLFVYAFSFSQDSPIKWGTAGKGGGEQESFIPLGWNDGSFYTIRLDKNASFLLQVDKDMNIKSENPIITDWKKFDVDGMIIKNNQIISLTSDYSKEDKATYVYASNFDFSGKLGKVNRKTVFKAPVEKKNEATDIQYFFSPDSSLILILHEYDLKNDDKARVMFSVLNLKDFSTVWGTTVDLPYTRETFDLLTAAVGNDGVVLLLSSIKGEEGKKLEKYSDHAFIFRDKTKNFTEKELKIEGKYISSAGVEVLGDKKVMITGFYNDLKNSGKNVGIEGAFVAIADNSQGLSVTLKTKPLDPETKNAVVRTGALASLGKGDEMNAYNMRVIHMNSDQSGYVIAEQRFIRQEDQSTSVTRAYYFNSLVMYRFDVNQEIRWIATVPKQQSTAISTPKLGIGPLAVWYFPGWVKRYAYKYNSFISTEDDGKIYLLYNDHKDNGDAKTLKDTKLMSNKNKALATLVTVDFNGKWSKQQLFSGKDMDVILDPASCYTNGKYFLISAERGKNLQFGYLAH